MITYVRGYASELFSNIEHNGMAEGKEGTKEQVYKNARRIKFIILYEALHLSTK